MAVFAAHQHLKEIVNVSVGKLYFKVVCQCNNLKPLAYQYCNRWQNNYVIVGMSYSWNVGTIVRIQWQNAFLYQKSLAQWIYYGNLFQLFSTIRLIVIKSWNKSPPNDTEETAAPTELENNSRLKCFTASFHRKCQFLSMIRNSTSHPSHASGSKIWRFPLFRIK